MTKMKTPMAKRTHPRVVLEIISGNNGLVQVWIVATSSIDAAILGSVDKHREMKKTTRATVCHFGLAFGNVGAVFEVAIVAAVDFLFTLNRGKIGSFSLK